MNGHAIPDEKLTEWEQYKRKCRNLTRYQRKTLLNEWNGYDFYDNEYIKDYLILGYKSNLFPTLDHKKSIKYGFDKKNNCSKREKCYSII